MNFRLTRLAVGAIAFAALTQVAAAQDESQDMHRGPHAGPPRFESADQNGDGLISYDEAVESLPGMTEDRFKLLDSDADGTLRAGELRPSGPRRDGPPDAADMQQRFQNADSDADGKLNRSEVEALRPGMGGPPFDRIDTDKDGGLTPQELMAGRMHRTGPDGERRGRRMDMVEHLDTDGNGEVSLGEFKAARPDASEERFAETDADKNGGISREEMQAAMSRSDYAGPDWAAFSARVFDTRDTNADGGLSFDEMKAARRRTTEERFAEIDADKNGAVSKEEFAKEYARRAARAAASEEHRRPLETPKN